MKMEMSLAAVSMRSALKYRRNWDKTGPAVKLLQSLMPQGGKKKGYRLYIEPGKPQKMRFTVPPAVRVAVQKAGYIITDYLAKKCVKATDKDQKNVFNIGKVIAKDPHAKAAFDNDPQLQNTKSTNIQIVISCHPYDIIGMSTGRDWDKQSCMRLKDYREGFSEGQYNKHVKNDVAEGTLVAYAIRADDTNIQKPLCRCLLKPFVNDKGDVLYRRETSVYGNKVPGFAGALTTFLRKINAHVPEGFYEVVDGLYDDGAGTTHDHRVREQEEAVRVEDIGEDISLLVPYVKEMIESNNPKKAERILSIITQYSSLLHEDDVKELVELMRGSEEMRSEYANHISMHQLNPVAADIGRRAGLLDAFNEEQRVPVYRDLPPTLHSRFAQSGLPILRDYIVRLESDAEPNVQRMRSLINDLMTGTYPLPTAETFADCPRTKSWVFTMASAARFMPLFGYTEYEKQVHDLLVVLEGTEKNVDGDTVEDSLNIGPFTVGLSLCLLLDNPERHLDRDAVFRIPLDEAAPMLCKRRPFKAFERLKSGAVQQYMGRVKLLAFQQCLKGTAMQEVFKDVKPAVIEYMTENPDNFDTTNWDAYAIKSLCLWHLPLVKFVQNNTAGFAKNMHNVVLSLLEELQKWEGEPIDVEDNHFVEVLMRCAIATGRLLDPPVSIARKVAIEDMDNDTFFEWYKTAKEGGMPLLGTMYGHMTYTMPGEPEINLQMLDILPLLSEAANDVNNEDTLAFARFPMQTVVRANRNIIRAIKALPLLGTAITQFENYCDSMQVEETEEEDEAARELVDNGEMAAHLDPDDDDYQDQYAEYFDQAKKIIEDRNYKKVEINSGLVRVAGEILTQIGYDEDSRMTDMRGFFSNYDDDELEDYESNLEDSGENIVNTLTSLIDNASEERSKAGYGEY